MFTLKLEATDLKLLNECIDKGLYEKERVILDYNKKILDENTPEEIRRIYEIKCNSLRKDCSQLKGIKNKIEQKLKTYTILLD